MAPSGSWRPWPPTRSAAWPSPSTTSPTCSWTAPCGGSARPPAGRSSPPTPTTSPSPGSTGQTSDTTSLTGTGARTRPQQSAMTEPEQVYPRGVRQEERMMRGYTADKDKLQARLRRIEGQVRGLQRLVDEDAYCIDILTQIAAVNAALRGVSVLLLDDHLRHCVRDAVRSESAGDAIVTEATEAIERLLKS